MQIEQNIILDFSHVYPDDIEKRVKGLKRIDVSDIGGTDMYCTEEAQKEIQKRLDSYGPGGIHFLDNGNYHYATKFFAEKITTEFSLVLYDHHSDMQDPLFPGMLSCGSWAGDLLRCDPCLRQLILVGPDRRTIDEIPADLKEKLVCISMEELKAGTADKKLPLIDVELPIYISIDKDVLSLQEARTNWNQGDMPEAVLEKLLMKVFARQQVIGVDICGECSLQEPLQELMADEKVNQVTNGRLYHFLMNLFRLFGE